MERFAVRGGLIALLLASPAVFADNEEQQPLPRHLQFAETADRDARPQAEDAPPYIRLLRLPLPDSLGADDFFRAQPEPLERAPLDTDLLMGLSINPRTIIGLHVDYVGPLEVPELARRISNSRRDPTDPRFLCTSFGIRIVF